MLPVLIKRAGRNAPHRVAERGVTMALVALSLVAIISFAALAIDLGSLYEAKAEAQRAADAAALTAARIISITGITGDPTNGPSDGTWASVCGGASSIASSAAITVAGQNLIAGVTASTVHVYYGTSSGVGTSLSAMSCIGAGSSFAVNPVVAVYVQQATLPNFFSRVFSLITNGTTSNSGVSATSYAEAFNPSGSGNGNNVVPVQPRCVKPWMIPNMDPEGSTFVSTTGPITNPGVYNMNGGFGVIGETFLIGSDCKVGTADCLPANNDLYDNPPTYNSGNYPQRKVLEYIPAQVSGTPVAVPSCSESTGYQAAIAGCDQTTVYACGSPGATFVNLQENPVNPNGPGGDTGIATECLINYGPTAGGNDSINTGSQGTPIFPFLIQAGTGNPLVTTGAVKNNYNITTSNSIVTIPIIDTSSGRLSGPEPSVTVVGFLQAFVNFLDLNGNPNITVLNVAGCGNAAANLPVFGSSPVPVRLITPPPS